MQFRGNRVRNFKSLCPIAITNSSVNPCPPPKALVKQLPTYTWCLLSEEGGSPSHCHVTALLRELHRLQVRYRIQFKIYSSRLRPSTGNSKTLFHLRSQPCIGVSSSNGLLIEWPSFRASAKIVQCSATRNPLHF